MSVQISIDPVSFKKLDKRFKLLGKHYPEETFRAIVAILFDIKLIAQKKIKSNGNIVTARLRNSLFVKTPKQIYAKRSTNSLAYSYEGGSGNRDLKSVNLLKHTGAVGSNVEYADAIENGSPPHKIPGAFGREGSVDHPGSKAYSFLGFAAKTVNMKKRFNEIPKKANKKLKI